ncbi:DNA repair protein complementing XP-G cells homolog isoform X2 [Cryptotermes secundus]|uniref:DNA repair protein complementing XP-G cells homolog isoform X2 n=1 Tax=Cryptotermes secundus TaxID=105785 RepID=UPI001454E105|nr:DNA repair protein complementing XP-G cells homolog isoform X2 [Cryptotermes secundus]
MSPCLMVLYFSLFFILFVWKNCSPSFQSAIHLLHSSRSKAWKEATRNENKSKAEVEAGRIREQLLKNLVKHTALKQVLGREANNVDLIIRQCRESDMFELPPEERKLDEGLSGSQEDSLSSEEEVCFHKNWATADLHTVDVSSVHFKSLPANVRHDILSELKETRKQSSWGRLHEMPKESGEFSNYQMTRLLKRRSIQTSLEDAEKEMGGRSLSLGELEEMLSEQGVVTGSNVGMRIAADNVTRYVYIKEIGKQLLAKSKPEEISVKESSPTQTQEDKEAIENMSRPDTDVRVLLESVPCKEEEVEEFEENWSSNSEEDFVSSQQKPTQRDNINLKLAQNFIFENSGLTQQQILAIIQYQNSMEGELQQNNEYFLSPDQPSTSGKGSKEKALQNGTDVSAFSGIQSRTDEATCSKTCVENTAEAVCGRTSVNNTVEAAKPSCSRTGVNMTSEANFSRTGIGSTAEAACNRTTVSNTDKAANPSCSRTCVSIADKADCSGTGLSNTAEARCSRIDVSHSYEASCTGIDVRNSAEATYSRTAINSTCDANILDKWKTDVLNDKTVEENSSAARQGVGKTENNIADSALTPVVDIQRNSNIIEQLNSDSDSDTDFVEVTYVATSPVHSRTEKNTLELLIQKDKICEIEDDIFADIFSAQTSTGILATNSNQQDSTIDSLSSSYNIHTGLRGIENSKFDKEGISNGISDPREGNESKLKDSKLVENVVTQDDCRQTAMEVEADISTISGIEPEEKDKKSQAAQVTTTMLFSEELQKLQMSLEVKHEDLLVEKGKQERLAVSITDQMYVEAQELLQLFGIPYIVAPMEAEAQCAFLDSVSLTDGTITDDSDIWLFGGNKVYKNFFNQKKHVMCFKASDIKQCFKLERQQLILLALLVGSDYTPGIQGVGPVTALEILAAFPAGGTDDNILRGLRRFQDWWSAGMPVGSGKTSLKNKLKDIQLVEGFPSVMVADAYLHPKVDESEETFTWGLPDLTSLRDFTRQKFGWTKTKTDEILLPVMKKLEERKSQMSLDSYFRVIPKLQETDGKLSKRVQQAVHRLGSVDISDSEESILEGNKNGPVSQPRKKQTNRTVNIRAKVGEARGSRGRGRRHDSSTVCEQSQTSEEFIPQRERDKINALKRKLKAVEVFHTSKTRLNHSRRRKKVKRQELKETKLSESDSDPE